VHPCALSPTKSRTTKGKRRSAVGGLRDRPLFSECIPDYCPRERDGILALRARPAAVWCRMSRLQSKFLTAEWRHLAMLNFDVDPKVLLPLVPAETELDDWQGRTFVSVVGFLFLNTRVFGVAIPWHRNFEEVNLRFYVRRKASDGWRRGVVFVKELVPRAAIALTARIVYGENYTAVPMRHRIDRANGTTPGAVSYSWRFQGRQNRMELTISGDAAEARGGSDVEFITEHYWGYARRRGGRTMEYRVEHPRWRVSRATEARLDCDVEGLYGSGFVEFLQAPPASAFLADGSEVTVLRGTFLPS